MATRAAKAAALSAAADEISKLEGITLASAKRSATVAETRFEREVKSLKSAIADLKTDLRSAIAADLVAQKTQDKMNDAKEKALSMFDIAVQKDENGCDLEEFDAKQDVISSTASTMTYRRPQGTEGGQGRHSFGTCRTTTETRRPGGAGEAVSAAWPLLTTS